MDSRSIFAVLFVWYYLLTVLNADKKIARNSETGLCHGLKNEGPRKSFTVSETISVSSFFFVLTDRRDVFYYRVAHPRGSSDVFSHSGAWLAHFTSWTVKIVHLKLYIVLTKEYNFANFSPQPNIPRSTPFFIFLFANVWEFRVCRWLYLAAHAISQRINKERRNARQ